MFDIANLTNAIIKKQHIDIPDNIHISQDLLFMINNLNMLIDDYNLLSDNNKSIETLIKLLQDTTNKLEQKVLEFSFLEQIASKGINDISQQDLFETLLEIINEETGAQLSAFILKHSTLRDPIIFFKNIFNNDVIESILPQWNEIYTQVSKELKPFNIENPGTTTFKITNPIFSSLICFPLQYRKKVFGALFIAHKGPGFFSDEQLTLMEVISKQISIILKNRLILDQFFLPPSTFAESIINTMTDLLFVLDSSLNIISVNNAVISAINRSSEEIIETPFVDLLPNKKDRDTFKKNIEDLLHKNNNIEDFRCFLKMINENQKYFSLSASLVKDINNNINAIIILARDITQRNNKEIELKKAYCEKELLLNEIYHRVNNNFQIIIGLLNLQQKLFDDERLKSAFFESQHRIQSIAFVHKILYQSNNFSNLDMNNYVSDLSDYLLGCYKGIKAKIAIKTKIDEFSFSISDAIPTGLILNELLTNSIKHAFVNLPSGTITVNGKKTEKEFIFMVRDDGIGLPIDFDINNSTSIGFNLVFGLLDQIKGRLEIKRDKGTKILFSVPFND